MHALEEAEGIVANKAKTIRNARQKVLDLEKQLRDAQWCNTKDDAHSLHEEIKKVKVYAWGECDNVKRKWEEWKIVLREKDKCLSESVQDIQTKSNANDHMLKVLLNAVMEDRKRAIADRHLFKVQTIGLIWE